ncbi:TGF-beta receptor/activin receptor, type I/II domain-containing protein [Aphelenchoides fujianensis]|nr:TGF-beta receptor/activin receptor, type I/II domain-containing protein [Aphelenchoides fujianensis]
MFSWVTIAAFLFALSDAKCFNCADICHNEQCNCQTGSCESEFCFTEKRPIEQPGVFRIVKGCVKRPSRTRVGCDFDRTPNAIQCVCTGDFCNDAIYMMRSAFRRNITCRECNEREPDCSETCRGS